MSEIALNVLKEINFDRTATVGLIILFVYIICAIRPYIIKILDKEEEYIQSQIKDSEYEYVFKIAYDVWNKVDEDFRIKDKITEQYNSKKEYFNDLLLSKIPSLKQEDLDFIRQAIAGEINCNTIKSTITESSITNVTDGKGGLNESN